MNLRTIERSKARHEGRETRSGPERGTTGAEKGPAAPIRPGFRWRVGRPARPAARRGVQRLTLPAVVMEPQVSRWRRMVGKVAEATGRIFRRLGRGRVDA